MSSNAEWSKLCNAALDSELDERARQSFERGLIDSPELAREFARVALLHDAIERELNVAALGCASAQPSRGARPLLRWLAAAAALFVTVTVVWSVLSTSPAQAARAELERIVAAVARGDRSFTIRAFDESGNARDYGRLHVRTGGQYVLERREPDGSLAITGSDGRVAWSIPARGAVRVSSDPRRFRGALPGEQHDLPFVDPRDGLDELAGAYELQLEARDGALQARLVATRKRDVSRGPKRVELTYDPDSGRLLRMRLERLPQAKSGPRTVEFELLDERPLPADFFDHAPHHDAAREVLHDD